jgi:hypothetical protein
LKFPRATFSHPLLPLSSTTANTTSTASKRTLAGALNESEDATSKQSQTCGVPLSQGFQRASLAAR